MRILVIFCHPSDASFGAALYDIACRTLIAAGHELRLHDLYRENFQPVLSKDEWQDYLPATQKIINKHPDHIDDLRWCEGLVIIYPTWFYGAPAMLKGWLERVWLPTVTFEISEAKYKRPRPKLTHIRLFVGITTSGSPWWWIRLIGDPGRRLWTRGLRVVFGRSCKVIWRQLYDMNNSTQKDRLRFLTKIETVLKRIR